ncbi:MAG: response regulator transcription factor [Lachnospiraceae bacterium]|nr:response regulator transcription factor [Lachnospiraceae bacterium]
MKILLIEDDAILCDTIKNQLTKEAHIVDACTSGEDGLIFAINQDNGYELAIIDRMLPVIDGLTILKAMRQKQIQIPVIIITGMSGLDDKIEGLDNGADDYLVKPFHIKELSARIRALTRRPPQTKADVPLAFGDLILDLGRHELKCQDRQISLTPKEMHLLCVFFKTPETIFSREQLLQQAWDSSADIEIGNVDNYIYFLRKRLKSLGSRTVIRSVYGSGYLLEIPD